MPVRTTAMASSAEQYYGTITTGREDYYLDVRAEWAGSGAPKLTLVGPPTKAEHSALFNGFDPKDPERKVVQNAGQMTPYAPTKEGKNGKNGRKPGWDCGASLDKTVGVIYAIEPKERPYIREAMLFGGRAVVAFFEERTVTRTGKGGCKEESAELVILLVPHSTARPVGKNVPDPQPHLHIFVYNVAVSPTERTKDGHPKTRSLRSESFYELQREADKVFLDAVRSQLEKRYEIESTPNGWRIKGVPEALCKDFSKRTAELEAIAPRSAPAWEREKAAKESRSKKGNFTQDELDHSWAKTGAKHEFTRESVQKLLKTQEVVMARDEKSPLEPSKDGKKTPWAYEVTQRDEKGREPGPTIVTEPRGIYPKREDASLMKHEEEANYFTRRDTAEKPAPHLLPPTNTKEGHELNKRLLKDYVNDLEKRSNVLGVTWRTSDAERVEREIGVPALSVHRSLTNLERDAAPGALDVIRAQWRYATWQISARERDSVIREREKATRYELQKGTTVLFIGERSDALEFKDFLKETKRYGAKVVFTEDLLPRLRAEEERRRQEEPERKEGADHTLKAQGYIRLEAPEKAEKQRIEPQVPSRNGYERERSLEMER